MNVFEFAQVDPSACAIEQAKIAIPSTTMSPSTDSGALRAVFKDLGPWPESLEKAIQAVPIFLPQGRIHEMQRLCESLHKAVCDIIDRWWDDMDSKFWEKMPIDPKAEELLRWLSTATREKRNYKDTSGLWRPDLLISKQSEKPAIDVTSMNNQFGPVKICEINCRYPLSGYVLATTIDNFHRRQMSKDTIFETTAPEIDSIMRKRFSRYETTWFLLGEGIPHVELVNIQAYFSNIGLSKVRFVRPEHLDVVADDQSPSGSKLVATTSFSDFFLEDQVQGSMDIDIIVIGARQAQLLALPTKILQELAMRCLNDLRSIFLAHDKRMLAIVSSELENLVSNRKVISHAQSEYLKQGLAETYIAGSKEITFKLHEIYSGKSCKDEWLLKPVASGKGKGIIFGTEIATEAEFHSLVRANEESKACVLQRIVAQPQFPMFSQGQNARLVNGTPGTVSCELPRYLVGTFMVSDGQFLGTFWRASPQRICAFMQGAWFLGAVTEKATAGT